MSLCGELGRPLICMLCALQLAFLGTELVLLSCPTPNPVSAHLLVNWSVPGPEVVLDFRTQDQFYLMHRSP